MTAEDMQLVREYVRDGSETAFSTLVTRYINLVYSAALRQVQDATLAEEITQAVFIILARKAASLGPKTILSAWLCRTARHVSANAITIQRRRQRREQEAYMQSLANDPGPEVLKQILPMLDQAMARLGEKDHDAIVLRFFDGRNLKDVGLALGTSEDGARKRVERAVEKLRKVLARQGVNSTAAIIAGAMASNSVQAAPAALTNTVALVAVTKGAAAGGSTLTLIKGALKLMAWTKAKTAIIAGAIILLGIGAATVSIRKIEARHVSKAQQANLDSWRVAQFAPGTLAAAAPQARILPTKFEPPVYDMRMDGAGKWIGVRAPVRDLARVAYNWRSARIIFPGGEPVERYDFAVTLPTGGEEALQREFKNTLGLVGRRQTMEADVLILKVKTPNAPGLKPTTHSSFYEMRDIHHGSITCLDEAVSTEPPVQPLGLTKFLELFIGKPVIDETGLTGKYDIELKWNENDAQKDDHAALKQKMLEQLGFELVPDRRSIEMLVVEETEK